MKKILFSLLVVIFTASDVFARGGGVHHTEIGTIAAAPLWLLAFEAMCIMLIASSIIMMIISITGYPRKVSDWIDGLRARDAIMYFASASISGIVLASLLKLILWIFEIKIQF